VICDLLVMQIKAQYKPHNLRMRRHYSLIISRISSMKGNNLTLRLV